MKDLVKKINDLLVQYKEKKIDIQQLKKAIGNKEIQQLLQHAKDEKAEEARKITWNLMLIPAIPESLQGESFCLLHEWANKKDCLAMGTLANYYSTEKFIVKELRSAYYFYQKLIKLNVDKGLIKVFKDSANSIEIEYLKGVTWKSSETIPTLNDLFAHGRFDAFKKVNFEKLNKEKTPENEELYECIAALMQYSGFNVKKNTMAAISTFEKWADQGRTFAKFLFVQANYLLGDKNLNPLKSFNYLIDLAHDGFSEAHLLLGIFYKKGIGCVQDYEKAKTFLLLAVHQKEKDAFYHLGEMYFSGLGTTKSNGIAKFLFLGGWQLGSKGCKEYLIKAVSLFSSLSEQSLASIEYLNAVGKANKILRDAKEKTIKENKRLDLAKPSISQSISQVVTTLPISTETKKTPNEPMFEFLKEYSIKDMQHFPSLSKFSTWLNRLSLNEKLCAGIALICLNNGNVKLQNKFSDIRSSINTQINLIKLENSLFFYHTKNDPQEEKVISFSSINNVVKKMDPNKEPNVAAFIFSILSSSKLVTKSEQKTITLIPKIEMHTSSPKTQIIIQEDKNVFELCSQLNNEIVEVEQKINGLKNKSQYFLSISELKSQLYKCYPYQQLQHLSDPALTLSKLKKVQLRIDQFLKKMDKILLENKKPLYMTFQLEKKSHPIVKKTANTKAHDEKSSDVLTSVASKKIKIAESVSSIKSLVGQYNSGAFSPPNVSNQILSQYYFTYLLAISFHFLRIQKINFPTEASQPWQILRGLFLISDWKSSDSYLQDLIERAQNNVSFFMTLPLEFHSCDIQFTQAQVDPLMLDYLLFAKYIETMLKLKNNNLVENALQALFLIIGEMSSDSMSPRSTLNEFKSACRQYRNKVIEGCAKDLTNEMQSLLDHLKKINIDLTVVGSTQLMRSFTEALFPVNTSFAWLGFAKPNTELAYKISEQSTLNANAPMFHPK